MVNIVRQFSLLRQLDDDITHRLNELVSHRACSSVPSKVLVSFSRDFMKCSNVRRVTVCEMIQVDLVVDKCLHVDLGGVSSRQGWCTGFVPHRTLWHRSFHCFPAFGILRRKVLVVSPSGYSCLGGRKQERNNGGACIGKKR